MEEIQKLIIFSIFNAGWPKKIMRRGGIKYKMDEKKYYHNLMRDGHTQNTSTMQKSQNEARTQF